MGSPYSRLCTVGSDSRGCLVIEQGAVERLVGARLSQRDAQVVQRVRVARGQRQGALVQSDARDRVAGSLAERCQVGQGNRQVAANQFIAWRGLRRREL